MSDKYTINFLESLLIGAIIFALLTATYLLHEKMQEVKPKTERVVKVTL